MDSEATCVNMKSRVQNANSKPSTNHLTSRFVYFLITAKLVSTRLSRNQSLFPAMRITYLHTNDLPESISMTSSIQKSPHEPHPAPTSPGQQRQPNPVNYITLTSPPCGQPSHSMQHASRGTLTQHHRTYPCPQRVCSFHMHTTCPSRFLLSCCTSATGTVVVVNFPSWFPAACVLSRSLRRMFLLV